MRSIQTLIQKYLTLVTVAIMMAVGLAAFAVPAPFAAAAGDPAATSTVPCGGSSAPCPIVDKYVNPAIALLAALTGILAITGIIIGGIQVTSSAGDPQKVASGKRHIRNSVIGVVAFIFLYAFLNWILPGGVI